MNPISSQELAQEVTGRTIPKAFVATARSCAERPALRWQTDEGRGEQWTFAEYAERVARVAAGYRARGIGPGDRIVLMLRNSVEFHMLDMAAYFVGAVPISIYNSSSPEQIEFLVGHCEARLALVEDEGFLARFRGVRHRLPLLKEIGILRPGTVAATEAFPVAELLESAPLDLEQAALLARPEDLATLIYTSGTTGNPKGVMLSHFNVAFTVESLRRAIGFEHHAGKRLLSYLPMAHIAERVVSHYQQAFLGYEITSCPEPSRVADYIRIVRPNLFFGVPRVWEKLYSGINAALSADPEKKTSFDNAVQAARPLAHAITWGKAGDEETNTWAFLDRVAFTSLRQLIGLDQCEIALTGAAPIPAEMLEWFRAIGVPLAEVYGMSESSGPMTFSAWKVKPGSVGQPIPGCDVRLADDGEVICRGGNVFQGYLNDPDKTSEALDAEGWLRSGDIGVIDEDGYFRIVDRKKELIITAGGKNISPANLEAALKMLPLVGQACAIGDRRPFVTALLTLDPDAARAWATSQGRAQASLAELAEDSEVIALVEAALAAAMASFNHAERVKRICILPAEWLPDSDCLTPTSKLKRRGIVARYAEQIEALYR